MWMYLFFSEKSKNNSRMSAAQTFRRAVIFIFISSFIILNTYPVYFRHIGVKDGLSQTSVMSIYEDELGRMWFGTEEGVSMYNGKELIAFKHSEDSVIARKIPVGNMSFPIVGDKNGNIYFRSDDKLLHYDIRKEQFSCLKDENVSTVYCKDSIIYVVSSDTIYNWDNKNKVFDIYLNTNLSDYKIQKIFIDSKKRLWIGTHDGLFLLTGSNEFNQIIKNRFITEIIEDSKSNIWIATRNSGMYKYCQEGVIKKFAHEHDNPNSIPHNQIRSFAEDNYGNLWIGTFRGLCRYNPVTETFTAHTRNNLPGTLHHSSVFSTYKDTQGNIWVGTYYGGVHYFNPETDRFSFYSDDIKRDDCLSHFFVGRMVEDKDNNIWICTEGVD